MAGKKGEGPYLVGFSVKEPAAEGGFVWEVDVLTPFESVRAAKKCLLARGNDDELGAVFQIVGGPFVVRESNTKVLELEKS